MGRRRGQLDQGLHRALRSTLHKATMIVECIEPMVTVRDPESGFQQQQVNLPALRTLIAAGKDLGEIALALEVLNAGDADQNGNAPAQGSSLENRPPIPN
ncbi:hypothetical protein [Deinococcus humi]|uniref:Uncharacterized protein n=1 Tax=Deinococcus humi TaxID=662880 RepID=A0A7W8JXS4_9DEIO|nr:hypothetical protein [Deinococcus humi]MBB5365202.1 hypothetical protein [Deinococcus humi]GGO35598.1 hypothetical protein GCM10008949_38310 [Deinococcus humi]